LIGVRPGSGGIRPIGTVYHNPAGRERLFDGKNPTQKNIFNFFSDFQPKGPAEIRRRGYKMLMKM
jgi:hypothetical protein